MTNAEHEALVETLSGSPDAIPDVVQSLARRTFGRDADDAFYVVLDKEDHRIHCDLGEDHEVNVYRLSGHPADFTRVRLAFCHHVDPLGDSPTTRKVYWRLDLGRVQQASIVSEHPGGLIKTVF